MAVTLEYTGFPHIFALILEYSDQPTQNQLRLLSSSTKLEVDLYHVRYIQICIVAGVESTLCLGALREPVTLSSYSPFKAPILSSPSGPARDGPNVQWALNNTRHVTVWDRSMDAPFSKINGLLSQLGERCTDVTVIARRTPPRLSQPIPCIQLPSSVRHLRVLFPGASGEPKRVGHYVVAHSCPTVTMVMGKGTDLSKDFPFVRGIYTPSIENLIVILDRPLEVASSLAQLSRWHPHLNLRFVFQLIDRVEPTRLASLKDEWRKLVNAKIEVKQYADGTPGVEGPSPTDVFPSETVPDRFLLALLGSL